VADDREGVVHGVGAGLLQGLAQIIVDERGFARGKRAQHGDQRPPGDAPGERAVPGQDPQPPAHPVEAGEGGHGIHQKGVFPAQLLFEA
jgi:hypothetical protein